MSKNRVIGVKNGLPWHLPNDLKHFVEVTKNKPVIMGRKTFESIGKALPKRLNIVITKQKDFQAQNCIVVNSFDQALEKVKGSPEVMVIGGAQIFEQALPRANRIYLTIVHAQIEGDTFFPKFNLTEWEEKERVDQKKDQKNEYDYSFIRYDRII